MSKRDWQHGRRTCQGLCCARPLGSCHAASYVRTLLNTRPTRPPPPGPARSLDDGFARYVPFTPAAEGSAPGLYQFAPGQTYAVYPQIQGTSPLILDSVAEVGCNREVPGCAARVHATACRRPVGSPHAAGRFCGAGCDPSLRCAHRPRPQLKPAPALNLTSPEYVSQLEEVFELGRNTSTSRTADQTDIAVSTKWWRSAAVHAL